MFSEITPVVSGLNLLPALSYMVKKIMSKPVFITGQQIGLLGGPLYTTYKVLGAIKGAADADGEAVYWLETNDADFTEINNFSFLDSDNNLKKLTWSIPSNGLSTGFITVDDSLLELITLFFDSVKQTEFTPSLRTLVFDCYKKGDLLKDSSGKLAEELFGKFGIRLFDPSEEEFRKFSKPILLKEADKTPAGKQCNLFCMISNKRLAVFKNSAGYNLRDGSSVLLEDYDLVPNVKTRNICQDAFFNTDTYVAGPGEIKYINELDSQYDFFNIKKSKVTARMTLTLLESKVKKKLQRYNISISDVMGKNRDDFVKQIITGNGGSDWNKIRNEAVKKTETLFKELDNLGLNTRQLRRTTINSIKDLVGQERKSEKQKLTGVVKDAEFLSDSIYPNGIKQERVFNIFYYMNLYGGLSLIDKLYDNYSKSRLVLEL